MYINGNVLLMDTSNRWVLNKVQQANQCVAVYAVLKPLGSYPSYKLIFQH